MPLPELFFLCTFCVIVTLLVVYLLARVDRLVDELKEQGHAVQDLRQDLNALDGVVDKHIAGDPSWYDPDEAEETLDGK